jgi:hypothetical protein
VFALDVDGQLWKNLYIDNHATWHKMPMPETVKDPEKVAVQRFKERLKT